jgi:hypothetical protein
MFVVKEGNRKFRDQLAVELRNQNATLRVIGSTKAGFRLAVARFGINDRLYIIGPVVGFKRQNDALLYGVTKFGVQATKVAAALLAA